MAIPMNYKEIAVVEGEFFPYILGRFENLNAYAIGVMDLNDDNTRMGQVSDIVFQFLITDTEFGWYETDQDKLNTLAQTLQVRMPKNRFLCAQSKSQKSSEELKAICDRVLGDDSLKDDDDFLQWQKDCQQKALAQREMLQAQKQRIQAQKEKEAARIAAMPKTPFNEARNALALHQRDVQAMDQTIKNAQLNLAKSLKDKDPSITPQDLQNQVNQDPQIAAMVERRKATSAPGKSLEEALGARILEAEEIFVAVESTWIKKYPFIDPNRASMAIFSTQELADRFTNNLRKSNRYYLEIRRIGHDEIVDALQNWADLGVAMLLVDDGEMPCRILVKNILAPIEKGYIERHNAGIRNLIIRNMQMGLTMKAHEADMEENWKKNQKEVLQKLTYHMFHELSKTILYCPIQIPDKQVPQFKGNIVYSTDANKKLMQLIQAEHLDKPLMNRPDFTGKHVVVGFGDSMLPIRMVTAPDQRNWLAAFTSRETAAAEAAKMPDSQVIALSLDDLRTQIDKIQGFLQQKGDTRTISGIVLDPNLFFSPVDCKQMDAAIKLRDAGSAQTEAKA